MLEVLVVLVVLEELMLLVGGIFEREIYFFRIFMASQAKPERAVRIL
jgi:hypothetical protein